MPTIEQRYLIAGSLEDVWKALTDPNLIRTWSGADATFRAEPGADYSLWGGDIRGRVLEVEPGVRLVQSWKPDDYPDDSLVTFLLKPSDHETEVSLTHENVPDWDYDDTNQGWDIYYLGAIKKMIEASAPREKPAAGIASSKKRAAAAKKAPARRPAAKRSKGKSVRKAAAKRSKTIKKKATRRRK